MGDLNKNIILIGMPGSGKTTIGKILSKKLGFKFIDTNECTDKSSSKLPSGQCSIISTEVDVLKKHFSIKENGVVIFIDKPVEKIIEDEEVLNNRTLPKDEILNLRENFHEKYKSYKNCCDLHLINNNNVNEVVYYICSLWS
ncbi:shikimate kinase [Clostridium scatologenes]|uniref:Shikimate kinase n=1 Tax=Clostridium scatologenes TaxID=1548 RepID=A0A0E3JN55_CLOSL|nr:shikimate kinase [Clostridium scatologenes]AKA68873.1 shikimate kinase [Clostridium scatologenes]